jgi:hypothetical protein
LLLAHNPTYTRAVVEQPWGAVWERGALDEWKASLEAEMARSKQVMEEFGSGGLPPGLEGVMRVMEAINRAEGTGLAIIFCDSQEDMRRADEALNNMSPPAEASGRRVSAGVYEVMHDVDMT